MFLSIIITVYNIPEEFLRECIESCLHQNIDKSDYEIICVNDGSTNNSLLILREYESKNINVRLLSQENMGISGARNSGIKIAQGDYVWFVDGDDYIADNSLGKLKDIAFGMNVDRLHLGRYHFIESLSNEKRKAYKNGSLKTNHRVDTIFATSSLYKRCFLKENHLSFRCEMKMAEDLVFNFEVDQIIHTESKVDDIFYFYRILENSLSHNSNKVLFAQKFIEAHLTGCKIVKNYYDNNTVKKIKTIRYLHNDLGQVMIKISYLNFDEARKHLKDILDSRLVPYKKWCSKGMSLTLYTNIYSFFLASVCRLSTVRVFFWVIRVYEKIWSSKIKKRVEKYVKNKFG